MSQQVSPPGRSSIVTERQLYRSLLFVPGTKLDWMTKSPKYGSDAVIFDLEDAVPQDQKAPARAIVAQAIKSLAESPIGIFVRVNDWTTGLLIDDIMAVVQPRLDGVVLPKVDSPDDVLALDRVISSVELGAGVQPGATEIIPLAETAKAVEHFGEICHASSRIARVVGVFGITPGAPGDLHRSLGVEASESGEELLYASGKLVASARAAEIGQILGGMTVDIANLDLLRRSLIRAKQFGSTGSMAIHPSHVAEMNAVFTPDAAELKVAAEIIRAVAAASASGQGAAVYDGKMVDLAHAMSSLKTLQRAEAWGVEVPEYPAPDTW